MSSRHQARGRRRFSDDQSLLRVMRGAAVTFARAHAMHLAAVFPVFLSVDRLVHPFAQESPKTDAYYRGRP